MKSPETLKACAKLDIIPTRAGMLYRRPSMRVWDFDPEPIYDRLGGTVDHFKRVQNTLEMGLMWPQVQKGICACGCGAELSGKRTRWATDACSYFANTVFAIIQGRQETIQSFIHEVAGDMNGCMGCGDVLDYHTAVKRGGGCWLGNFQQLCIPCHDLKSIWDRENLKTFKRNLTGQISLL